MTNATKATIIAAVNSLIGSTIALLVAFDVTINSDQEKAITGLSAALLNAGFLVWIAMTYKNSSKRIPD